MKALALIFLMAGGSLAVADANLLRNGDFSSGIAHWEGDCHTADNGTEVELGAMDSNSSGNNGVTVKLRLGDWTKVTQDFDGGIGEYNLTITYSVSPNLKFSNKRDDYVNGVGKAGITAFVAFNSEPGQWIVLLSDRGAGHCLYWTITPKVDAPGSQTISLKVHLDSDDTNKKAFCLIFPPGDGVITLHNISLVPISTASQ
jgi:hypothetical protein